MTTRGLQIPLIVLVVIAGVVAACCAQGSPNSSSSMVIVPGVSVGPVRAGMTPQQVIAELGKPDREHDTALEYWNLVFSVIPRGDRIHVVLCVDPSGQKSPFKKAFAGHTEKGIRMKSSRADIIRAYGEPSATEAVPGMPGSEILRYRKKGLYFRLRDGEVDTIGVIFHAPRSEAELPGAPLRLTRIPEFSSAA